MNKKITLLLLSLGSALSIIILIYAADRVVGNKFNKIYAGWNSEGYRGIKKKEKKEGFERIVTVGGSTTFGYGTTYLHAWPHLIEEKFLENSLKADVVNLGQLSQGIWAIKRDLLHYDYLDYDYVIFYSGYNDSNPNILNKSSARHYDLFFKLFGYLPILDTYIYEKMILIFYGDLEKFYSDKLKDTEAVSFSLDKENNPVRKKNQKKNNVNSNLAVENKAPFQDYINEYNETFRFLLNKNKKIIFIHQPKLENYNFIQREKINELLSGYPEIIQLDYTNLIDLSDKKISLDYMHLTIEGNTRLANKLFEDIQNLFK